MNQINGVAPTSHSFDGAPHNFEVTFSECKVRVQNTIVAIVLCLSSFCIWGKVVIVLCVVRACTIFPLVFFVRIVFVHSTEIWCSMRGGGGEQGGGETVL
jgi:hypothetical protein